MNLTNKTCIHCNEIKPTNEFGKHATTKDHLQSWCKSCYKKYKQQYNINNRAYMNKYSRDHGFSKYAYQKKFVDQRRQKEKNNQRNFSERF